MAKPISFARGAPSLDIVDVEGLREAADRAFTKDPGGATAYGAAIGYPPLRAWIAERHQVEPENVIVTNGSMQADAFLFEALVEPPKRNRRTPAFAAGAVTGAGAAYVLGRNRRG